MNIRKIFRNEDSLDDFNNRRRTRSDSKYITFSGVAKNTVHDDVKKVLNKKNILNPWIGDPGLQDFSFVFNVRNKEKDVRDALTALNALGERNTWFIRYNDGDHIGNSINIFSPDIPNGLWYSGDMDKIVDFIMPKKRKSEASAEDDEGPVKEYLEYEKGHKNSRGEDAPWVIRDHKNGKVLASFSKKDDAEAHLERMKHYSKDEKLFNKQELENMFWNDYKAAIKAAWSAAGVKWFRLDFQESSERLDVYPIASDNEGVGVNWGVLPEHSTIVQYTTDLRTGNSEIEREMPYKDLDELEKIFVDEFISMDETLEIGAENGADIHPLTEGYTATKGGKSFPVRVTYNENPDDWRGNTVPDSYTISIGDNSIDIDAVEPEKDCVRKGLRILGYDLYESHPTESEVDKFLHNALDWASIDDGENRIILKFTADGGAFYLVGYDGCTRKTLKSGELFSVVDRFRELVEMDQADAIHEFEKE